jgi:hypothetical protein
VIIFTAGDLHADEFEVKVRAAAKQLFDDNINYSEKNRNTDFISTLSAGASLNYEGKRTQAEFAADVTQQLYWDLTENNNTSEHLSLVLNHQLTKYDSIQITDTFTHAYDPGSFDEQFGRVSGRYSYYSNQFGLGYMREFSEQLSAKVNYGYDVETTSREDLFDSFVNRVSLEGSYALSSKSIMFTTYEYHNRELESVGNASVNTFGGGWRQNFTEQLSLEGRAGIDLIDSYNGEELTEPMWKLTLIDRLTETHSAILSFTQRYSTNAYTDDIFNSWRVSGGITSQLSKKVLGSATAFYGRGEYDSTGIEDNLFGGQAALSYDLYKNYNLDLSYSYSQTTSNLNSREYRKNVVFLGVSGAF